MAALTNWRAEGRGGFILALKYPCFVINLDRQPERYAAFRRWNGDTGLAIERFPATDGRELDDATRRSLTRQSNFTPGAMGNAHSHKRLWQRTVETGQTTVIFEDDAVLRKDIADVLPQRVNDVGRLWDIITLGFNTNTQHILGHGEDMPAFYYPPYPSSADLEAFRRETGRSFTRRLELTFGLCGYVLSPLGAAKLLERSFPMQARAIPVRRDRGYPMSSGLVVPERAAPVRLGGATLDGVMNSFYTQLEAYTCVPPLVLSPNDPATSTTMARPALRQD